MSELVGTIEQSPATEPTPPAQQFNAYFLELDRLLARSEEAATHYQMLGVERSATHEEIKLAYQKAVALLYPPYQISATLPEPMLERMGQAFERISRAFSVLANFGQRAAYDRSALPHTNRLHPAPGARSTTQGPAAAPGEATSGDPSAPAAPGQVAISIKGAPAPQKVYAEFAKPDDDNRRRCERFKLSIPARVTGHDRQTGKWHEMAETVNVSRTGLRLRLRRRVRHGMVLHLTLPLPMKLRQHGHADPSYNVYALVRRVEPPKAGVSVVGLEFLGEHPPAGYTETPWATFRTRQWGGAERRRKPREYRAESVWLEYLTDAGQVIAQHGGLTENLSRSGARICVKAAPAEFDLLRVTSTDRRFESLAAVTNRYCGQDGFERLCVQFLEQEWPL